MKYLLLIVLFFVALQPAYADSALMDIGGKSGVTFATWARTGDMPTVLDRTYAPGFTGGASLHLRRWKPVSPQFELLFTHKGSGQEIDGVSEGRFNLYYIDMLILARAEFAIKPVRLFAVAGPDASILLKSTFTFPGLTREESGYRRFDVGMVAGAGVAFGPFSWGTLTLEARYGMGFFNVNPALEEVDVSLTNRTISLMLGYEYRRARDR